MSAIEELDAEIAELEQDLEALRRARDALARRHRPLDEPSAGGAAGEGEQDRAPRRRPPRRTAAASQHGCTLADEGDCDGDVVERTCSCGYRVARCEVHGGRKAVGPGFSAHVRHCEAAGAG